MVAYCDAHDPLSILLAPPPNETPEQRKARETDESDARKKSLRVDEELRADKAAMKKRNNSVKVLVLGQSESGLCLFVSHSKVLCRRCLLSTFREIYRDKKCVFQGFSRRVVRY
jgi:hypothetical protein